MKKRDFLKLSSTLLATPVLPPLANLIAVEKIKNWAGNFEFSTTRLEQAKSLQQVQKLVKGYGKMKVIGTRHCFNRIADSPDQLISLVEMKQVLALDTKAKTVTVDANMKYGDLATYLNNKGFALHNLASLPHISIAGACATATHGSGIKNGNLATAVAAMEIVLANGEVRTLSRTKDGEAFRAAVVHLGGLGVVTKITLDIQPTFMMRQYVYENLPLEELKNHFEAIESSAYSVSLFTDWQKKRINEVWLKKRVGPGEKGDAKPEFYGAKLATKNLHPIAELSAVNCTEQLGVPGPWYERLPHFRMGFTPSSGKELQSEFFVPYRNAIEAILAVERLRDYISPHLLISEIRTIDADDFWMSPCYKQPSMAIHFTWKPDWPSVRKVLPMIERELAPFKVRPHWGKLFTLAPAQLQSRYEKLPEFKQLMAEYDPKGKFRNEFLNTNLLGR
ncbi:D-arabinono-1,4-lactone oxidase [Larkinella terrae]|uniref:FAD-binding protein n=1 Tax=Larkinella terrae TaxID=2025311 RepID=A0A7K0EUN8_9BACT|nr:D-arabinono-1,4-lactone oxidase [Larkinella terrae]MRS65231.1 FAD-binding protein [Larkinella terrae]